MPQEAALLVWKETDSFLQSRRNGSALLAINLPYKELYAQGRNEQAMPVEWRTLTIHLTILF